MDLTPQDKDQLRQGEIYAVRLLTASKKSESELLKRLELKGYPSAVAHQVVDRLKQNGVLDDRKLIEDTVQWSIQSKKWGRRRISFELKKRGVKSSAITEALDQYSEDLEFDLALEQGRARWHKFRSVEFSKRKKRVYDYLINRGFDYELARNVITKLETKSNENI